MSSSSGSRGDVRERARPALLVRLERDLLHVLRVDPDGVAAGAEAAVDRAGVEREEERLVDVPMGEPRYRRVGLLVEGIEVQLRVVGEEARREGKKLDPQRIGVGVGPVDERQQIRAHAHAHRRALHAERGVVEEPRRGEVLHRLEELFDLGDRVLRLPVVIEKLVAGHLAVRRDLLPERPVGEVPVGERRGIDGGLLGDDRVRRGGVRRTDA